MPRGAVNNAASASLILVLGTLFAGCGASEPRESDIYHDPALRPTVVETSEADRPLLESLNQAGGDAPIEIAGRSVSAPYHAASGHRCRTVSGERPALVCEVSPGQWAFVPSVVMRESP